MCFSLKNSCNFFYYFFIRFNFNINDIFRQLLLSRFVVFFKWLLFFESSFLFSSLLSFSPSQFFTNCKSKSSFDFLITLQIYWRISMFAFLFSGGECSIFFTSSEILLSCENNYCSNQQNLWILNFIFSMNSNTIFKHQMRLNYITFLESFAIDWNII